MPRVCLVRGSDDVSVVCEQWMIEVVGARRRVRPITGPFLAHHASGRAPCHPSVNPRPPLMGCMERSAGAVADVDRSIEA